jgi:putative endonuclease
MDKTYAVYILTNFKNSTFYIGVTGNLQKRIWEHKNKVVGGFTNKYNVDKLVYYELTDNVESALNREKQLKRWHRDWKINLIKEINPEFKDLSLEWEGAF